MYRSIFIIVFLFCLVNSSFAESDYLATEIINNMALAHQNRNYNSYVIHATLGDIDSFRVSHGTEIDKINKKVTLVSTLNGTPNSMMLKDNKLIYIDQSVNYHVVKNADFPNFYLRFIHSTADIILDRYIPITSGQSRVADRNVQVLRLLPKNGLGYALILAIDIESGILVQLDVVELQGKLIERYMTVNLIILEKNSEELNRELVLLPQNLDKDYVPNLLQEKLSWSLRTIPTNFQIVSTNKHAILGYDVNSEYMLLSDKLTDISVYLTKHEGEITIPITEVNAMTVYRQKISPNYDVSIVGCIPIDMAKLIADSVVIGNDN